MNTFTRVIRLAQLYGWSPIADPQEIERYLSHQYGDDTEESGAMLEAWNGRSEAQAPHRLAPDLRTLAKALERALPDIPDDIECRLPRSLLEHFAEDAKDWLRNLIAFCRGQYFPSWPNP